MRAVFLGRGKSLCASCINREESLSSILELREWPQSHEGIEQSRQRCVCGVGKFSAAVPKWAACRCGGDLDLGGSPRLLKAGGIILAALSGPSGMVCNLPDPLA